MGERVGPGSGLAPADRAVVALRLALGAIWTANLVFIVAPQNQFFATFSTVARSYRASSLGGATLPGFVADNPILFGALIAVVTAFLAAAFLSGVGVRWACGIGAGFAVVLLLTQWGTTFALPGGTDVGPQPVYLGGYLALLLAGPSLRWTLPAAWAYLRNRRAKVSVGWVAASETATSRP